MASGGYRTPANPAQVSGPGELSQRTDGSPQAKMQLPDAKYGEQKSYQEIQSGAPVGAPASGGAPAGVPSMPPPTGLDAPSASPDEPVTAGASEGAGPGPEALGLPQGGESKEELRKKFGPILPALIAEASGPYATQVYRDAVQGLIASM